MKPLALPGPLLPNSPGLSSGTAIADVSGLSDKLKAIILRSKQMPMMSEAAVGAMQMINSADTTPAVLAKVIERDPALATGLLRLANSVLYRVGRTITSLPLAIMRVGMQGCRNLIISVALRNVFQTNNQAQRRACQMLYKHSFLTACLCRRLNQLLGLGFQGEEVPCGLSHDIGRLLLAISAPDDFADADPLDFLEGDDLLTREQLVLGCDHCTLGAWYASINQLPQTLVCAIQHHHAPREADSHDILVGLVATADHVANHLQRGQPTGEYDLTTNPGWLFLAAGADERLRTACSQALPTVMAEAVQEAQGPNV